MKNREEAEEKLKNVKRNKTFNLSVSSEERQELLTELLMNSSEKSIARCIYKAIRFYLNNREKPSVASMVNDLAQEGLPEKKLRKKSGEKIEQIYSSYFSAPIIERTEDVEEITEPFDIEDSE